MSKKHGDSGETAMHEVDGHTLEQQEAEQQKAEQQKLEHPVDAVPPADTGAHAHSAAAHLKTGGAEHTKPEGNLRQGSHPGARREPPMVVQRAGKQHRG